MTEQIKIPGQGVARFSARVSDVIRLSGCNPSNDLVSLETGELTPTRLLELRMEEAPTEQADAWNEYVDELCFYSTESQ